jgi:predicted Fe-S protein YdhL (DUF1289 family)
MSPCVNICKADRTNLYCIACCRTLMEIQKWQWMTEEEQARTVALCEIRKLAQKLDRHDEQVKAAPKNRRTKPCSGHDSQG